MGKTRGMGKPLRRVHLIPEEDQDLKPIELNPNFSGKVRLRDRIRVLS